MRNSTATGTRVTCYFCVWDDCKKKVCVHGNRRTPQEQVTDTFDKMCELIERRTFKVEAFRPSQKFDQMLDLLCKVPVVLVKICLDEISTCRSTLLVTVGRAAVSF